MIFEVGTDIDFLGCHLTWLSGDITRKRDAEPQRQFFGAVSGGHIRLYDGELDPSAKLVIAEGIETALSAAQLGGGIPAIAAMSANNFPKISPPLASEYLISADNDPPGLQGARALAVKLVRAGHKASLAIPPRAGTDWNDVILERLADAKI
ncbi:MAG: toprim domain-containing protein [Rhodoplanes sp.]